MVGNRGRFSGRRNRHMVSRGRVLRNFIRYFGAYLMEIAAFAILTGAIIMLDSRLKDEELLSETFKAKATFQEKQIRELEIRVAALLKAYALDPAGRPLNRAGYCAPLKENDDGHGTGAASIRPVHPETDDD